jgi:beta-galactosidase
MPPLTRSLPLWIALVFTARALVWGAAPAVRTIESFDPDWRFRQADAPGADQPDFPDSGWRRLDVPHDWSIEGAFDRNAPSGPSGGFLPTGIGWYRRHFSLAPADRNRRFFIQFDGVMENSDVWINGFHLGHRPYGYVGFHYDLTGHLKFGGEENVLAVRVDDSLQPNSRWYTGAGIYRHVRLIGTAPVHLDLDSAFVSTPQAGPDQATVRVAATVRNDSDENQTVVLAAPVSGPDGGAVAAGTSRPIRLGPGQSADLAVEIPLAHPRLWNLDDPNLYTVAVQVRGRADRLLDDQPVDFGVRRCEFRADTGFWLNGRNLKLLGSALHHDAGAWGAAVPLSIWRQRLELLRAVGCNAIRTSHNPPAPEFLDLCDRLGFVVMDELFDTWSVAKTSLRGVPLNDYHLYFKAWWPTDVADTLRRDRNHPSIVIYSAGNEIRDINPRDDLGSREFTAMRDLMHRLDPTRPVTVAVLRPNQNHVYSGGFAELMDVVGQNYRENELLAAHAADPRRRIIGTENHGDLATWLALRDHPAYAGQFIWTGFDYLGEETGWPAISHASGFYDRTGERYGAGYQRQSWWTHAPMVQIVRVAPAAPQAPDPADPTQPRKPALRQLCDWTPGDLGPHVEHVEIYSTCEAVKLVLNGRSLGSQDRPADDAPRVWLVPFAPGKIKAFGSNGGRVVATCELRTAGRPAGIQLSVDRSNLPDDWDDVAVVRATLVDAHGTRVPGADATITFQVAGPATIAAVDSGSLTSHEPFRGRRRRASGGTCVAYLRASADQGPIFVSASADGCGVAQALIAAAPARRPD